MHGLILRAIQNFVRDTYGHETWINIVTLASTGFNDFEPLKIYPPVLADNLVDLTGEVLNKPRSEVLEDMGTYLVAHPNSAMVRRLLRFGGDTFLQFVHSLNELPDRVRLAVPDLELPDMDLREHYSGALTLTISGGPDGFGHMLVGLLRAMADDFGTLVMLNQIGRNQDVETLEIQLLEIDYTEGQAFNFARTGS